jgi:hypothetical protein
VEQINSREQIVRKIRTAGIKAGEDTWNAFKSASGEIDPADFHEYYELYLCAFREGIETSAQNYYEKAALV